MSSRVLVLWADNSSANLGVRVLAEGMRALAMQAWGSDIEVDFQDYGLGDSNVSFGTRSIARDIGRRRGPIKEKLREYDCILDSGAGDSFADIYGLKRLTFMVYARHCARLLGIPVVMGPQTIGPFNSRIGRFFGRHMLLKAAVVTARDSWSVDYAQSLGRAVNALGTDVVFALPNVSEPKSRDVVVNVSGLLWFSDRHVNSTAYKSAIRQLVAELEAEGRIVSLLAHVTNRESKIDDAAAIRELMQDEKRANEVLIPDSLDQVRRYVGSAQLVIGSRMHACLNALSVGTPAIPWAYSRKFEPLLAGVGWDISIDLRSEVDPVGRTMHLMRQTTAQEWQTRVKAVRDTTDSQLAEVVLAFRKTERRSN